MSMKMNLLVIAHTGHVVAGLTRTSEGADLDAAALGGDALPVRSIRRENDSSQPFAAWLPASVLEVKSAPFDPRVLASPQDYVIDGGAAVRIASDAPSDTVTSLEQDQLDLKDDAALPGQEVLAVVAALVDQRSEIRVQAGKYPPQASDPMFLPLTLLPDDTPASLPSGTDCGVMVALAGKRLFWTVETVT